MRKAFTLIELLMGVAILFILFCMIAPPIIEMVRGNKVQDNGITAPITAPERTVPVDRMYTEQPTVTVPAERVIKDGGKMEVERK
jgi:prepilin-type N-terminal cleavage/methylation domain-containing protein